MSICQSTPLQVNGRFRQRRIQATSLPPVSSGRQVVNTLTGSTTFVDLSFASASQLIHSGVLANGEGLFNGIFQLKVCSALTEGIFYLHRPTESNAHSMDYVTPDYKHCLGQAISQGVHQHSHFLSVDIYIYFKPKTTHNNKHPTTPPTKQTKQKPDLYYIFN